MDRVARRGPLARAPGALKGDTSKIVNIFVAVEGGPFGEKTNFRKKSHNAEKLKEGILWGFSTSILSAKHQKIEGGIFYFRKKISVPKKTKGDPLGFSNIHSDAKQQKNWRWDPSGKIFFEKVSQCRKKWKGDPLVSPGMVCYAEKQEKPFWFSSLGQIVQFGAIIFCRTFKNYFGQFVLIEKSHYNSRVSLHEAPI